MVETVCKTQWINYSRCFVLTTEIYLFIRVLQETSTKTSKKVEYELPSSKKVTYNQSLWTANSICFKNSSPAVIICQFYFGCIDLKGWRGSWQKPIFWFIFSFFGKIGKSIQKFIPTL